MNKRIFVYLGIIVAVVIGIGVLRGVIPPKSGTEGTIGAANRYQSPQIADKDVALENSEFNDLLQSDVVHKLATNAEFRKMWQDVEKRIANDPAAREILANQDFAKLLGDGLAADLARNVKVVERGAKAEEVARGAKVEEVARGAKVEEVARGTKVTDAISKGAQQTALEKHYIVDVARAKADLDKRFGGSDAYQRVSKLPAFEDVLRSPFFAELAAKHSTTLTELSRTSEGQALWKSMRSMDRKANLDAFDRALSSGSSDTERRVH